MAKNHTDDEKSNSSGAKELKKEDTKELKEKGNESRTVQAMKKVDSLPLGF